MHSDTCTMGAESCVQQHVDETFSSEQGISNMHHDILTNASSGCNCSCPSQISTAVSNGITFENLDPTISYSASVSRNMEGSFIALQPKPIKPLSINLFTPTWPPLKPPNFPAVNVTFPLHSTESEHDDDSVGPNTLLDGNFAFSGSSSPAELDCFSGAQDDTIVDFENESRDHAGAPVVRSAVVPATTHSESVQTDLAIPPHSEIYLLGDRVEHRTLDWGGTFPGSHTFYRTQSATDEEIFILRPKQQTVGDNEKRKAQEDIRSSGAKRRNLQEHVRSESEDLSERTHAVQPSLHPQTPCSMTGEGNGISARGAAASMTPLPESGITYRY